MVRRSKRQNAEGARNQMTVKTIPFRPKRAEALDLDHNNQFQMLKRLLNAEYMGKQVTLKRSPSGRGYHIYCTPPLTLHESLMLGDCKGRVRFWEKLGFTFTFNHRLDWHGKIVGQEIEENPLSKPFKEKIERGWMNGKNKSRDRRLGGRRQTRR